MTHADRAEEMKRTETKLANIGTHIEGLDLQTVGSVLVKSGYFQDTKEIAQAMVKVLAGRELGFGPIASMQGIYIVNGRVSMGSNLIGAAIQRSGRYRYRVIRLDKTGCTIKFYERWEKDSAWIEIGESTFDPTDATAAGLTKSNTYQHYPRNMYFARALTNGARWYTPDVFNGPVYTPDEMGATVDEEGNVIAIPAAPPMDTAEVQRNAKEYVRVFGDGSDEGAVVTNGNGQQVERATGEVLEEQPKTAGVAIALDLALTENARLVEEALAVGAPVLKALKADASWSPDRIRDANHELGKRIKSRQGEVDRQFARQSGQRGFEV